MKPGSRLPVKPSLEAAVFITSALLLLGCENLLKDVLPAAYREEEFSLAPLDESAVNLLNADSLAIAVAASTVDTVETLMADSILVWPGEVNWEIVMPGDTAYAVFVDNQGSSPTTQTRTMVFFLDDIVKLTLADTGGNVVDPVADHIPLETIAYGPEIRTRLEFDLRAGVEYLMQFVASRRSFHLVVLYDLK